MNTVCKCSAERSDISYRSGVYSDTVVLIVHIRSTDMHVAAVTNVESIRIVPSLAVSSGVVYGHIRNGQTITPTDADRMDRRILDMQVCNGRVGEAVRREELGLRLPSVTALAVPPPRTLWIQNRPRRALNGNPTALNGKERPNPFLVTPCSFALKDDLMQEHLSVLVWTYHGAKLTVVPSARLDRSSVTPDGTATLLRTMVAHAFCDTLASDAPFDPEKVQLVALLATSAIGGGVIAGSALGSATGDAATSVPKKDRTATPCRYMFLEAVTPEIKAFLGVWPTF